MENVTLRTRVHGGQVCMNHGYVLGYERLTDHAPKMTGPRPGCWRIRAGSIVDGNRRDERPFVLAGRF